MKARRRRPSLARVKPAFKLWLETDTGYALGGGGVKLLEEVERRGSITEAAKSLRMSYRYAWGLIRKIEKNIGAPMLETFRGGSHGGGGAKVTQVGLTILRRYENLEEKISHLLNSSW